MIGVLTQTESKACRMLRDETDALQALAATEWRIRRVWDVKYRKEKWSKSRAERIRALRRCEELSHLFPEVERDESCKRRVQQTDSYGRQGQVLEIPLIFHATLPAKRKTELSVYLGRDRYSVTARTPMPTMEAVDAIREHKDLFDHLEVWWVPNDVLVEKIPDPDPLLVGVVCVESKVQFAYELCRWVDRDVEDPWWSKEAY